MNKMYRRMKGTIMSVESNSLGHSRSLNGIGKKTRRILGRQKC